MRMLGMILETTPFIHFMNLDESRSLTEHHTHILDKPSKVNIWPVFLAINELPPEEQFAKKHMILWGLWQGKGKTRFSPEIFAVDLIRL